MNKPTRKDTINLRVWQSRDGITIIENIVGVVQYPMAIHRPLGEYQDIQDSKFDPDTVANGA
jgi:hypothetical protein